MTKLKNRINRGLIVYRMFILIALVSAFSVSIIAQGESGGEKKATEEDKIAVFDSDGKIKRGAAIGDSESVLLSEVLETPAEFADKPVVVSGFVVRSCKMEGCWAELGSTIDAAQTVRVRMKDHAFFIPLKSAGFKVLAEGVFSIKTLSKKEVDHLVAEDGAKFEKINPDGTVTEISFLAYGIELSKGE